MRTYCFDKIFGEESTQQKVFEELQVSYLVKRVIEVRRAKVYSFRVIILLYFCMDRQAQAKPTLWKVTIIPNTRNEQQVGGNSKWRLCSNKSKMWALLLEQ